MCLCISCRNGQELYATFIYLDRVENEFLNGTLKKQNNLSVHKI